MTPEPTKDDARLVMAYLCAGCGPIDVLAPDGTCPYCGAASEDIAQRSLPERLSSSPVPAPSVQEAHAWLSHTVVDACAGYRTERKGEYLDQVDSAIQRLITAVTQEAQQASQAEIERLRKMIALFDSKTDRGVLIQRAETAESALASAQEALDALKQG